MVTDRGNESLMNTGHERAQAMTLYVRALFRSIDTEKFSRINCGSSSARTTEDS